MESLTNTFQLFVLQQQVKVHLLQRLRKTVPPSRMPAAVKYFENLLTLVDGAVGPQRWIRSGKRNFWGLNYAGFPSKAYDRLIDFEINRFLEKPVGDELQNCILAITTKCGLKCEHCFEWDNLNVGEKLADDKLEAIVDDLLLRGVSQIQFSGGEPLNRFPLLETLVAKAAPLADAWILTSGYGLTENKAQRLAAAGCTGLSISCDHYDFEQHNTFRGNKASFDWVVTAAKNARKHDLLVCLTVCLPHDVDENFLNRYLALAQEIGAVFVQLLEPRAAGRYTGKAQALSEAQIATITNFTAQNNRAHHPTLPLIKFHGAYQRAGGCFGAGNRYLYIDSHGKVHKCPFCQNPNAPDYTLLRETLSRYQEETCGLFGAFSL